MTTYEPCTDGEFHSRFYLYTVAISPNPSQTRTRPETRVLWLAKPETRVSQKSLGFGIPSLRRSNQQGVRHFGANFRRNGSTDVSLTLTRSGRDMGLSYVKEIVPCRYLLPFEHNARTSLNVADRQTYRSDHGTVTSIAIGEIARQRCRLIIIAGKGVQTTFVEVGELGMLQCVRERLHRATARKIDDLFRGE